MTISINDIINYGNAKFKVVKTATSNDINFVVDRINAIDKNRKNSTVYSLGDIAFSPNLPSSLLLECTTAGTTAATEPDFSDAAECGTVNDGTAVWTYKKLLSSGGSAGGDGIPLAAIIPWDSDSNVIPPGFLECNGQAVSRADYADLFGVIGTKYGSGDGLTTFNVPDYTDGVFLEGSDTAGTEHAPGLPNIEGEFASVFYNNYVYGTGAFVKGEVHGNLGGGGVDGYKMSFDASQSNAIYGNSDTVQPKSSTTRYLIKFIPSVPESEASAAASASVAQAAAQAAESYAGSAGIPVSTMFPYAANSVDPPMGYLFCDGSAVSRTMYPDLFDAIGTTYGTGDGSTTFNLPTANDARYLVGSNVAGTMLAAGVPNIDGNLAIDANMLHPTNSLCGAFYSESTPSQGTWSAPTSYSGNSYSVKFDASQSNAIYGNSDTVTPKSLSTRYIIKAYDGVTPGSAGIDLTHYASALNCKADRDLSNLSNAGKAKISSDNFLPAYNSIISITQQQILDGYTAPTNGFVILSFSLYDNAILTIDNIPIGIGYTYNGQEVDPSTFLISEGEVIKASAISLFRSANFVPMKSEVSV